MPLNIKETKVAALVQIIELPTENESRMVEVESYYDMDSVIQ
jgi:hypothetical protein